MKAKRKVFLNSILILLMTVGGINLMSCNSNQESNSANTPSTPTSTYNVVEGKPDYSKNAESNVMRIGAWVSPIPANWNGKDNPSFITDEQYKLLAESGLNTIYALYENTNEAATIASAELSKKYNINYLARDTRLNVDPVLLELEEGDLYKIAKNYINNDAIAGHLVTDEPNANQFDRLGKLKELYEKDFPGKEFYVNLFPTYATLAQLGTDNYEQYIDEYIAKVKPDFVSYDHYALMVDGYGKYKITTDVLYNLEVVATKCKAANIPMYTFVQSMSYNASSRCPNTDEVRWQVLTEMAYGSKSIQYFCYFTPIEFNMEEASPAMIDLDGKPTDQYYAVQTVNKELLGIDEAYLAYDWEGTMVVDGTDSTSSNKAFKQLMHPLEGHDGIASIEASQDTLVGTFKDKDGRDGYLITNFSDPRSNKKDNVQVKFNGATKAVVYHLGVAEEVSLNDGKLDYELGLGDGIFVIPYK